MSVPVNVGDITITATTGANSCTDVVANGPATALSVSWNMLGGFNVPTIQWEWEDANHVPVGGSPISFTSPSGSSSFGGGTYASLPVFNLTNNKPQDGLLQYFFAITVSNGTSTATKYFPFLFDTSLTQSFCGAAGGARGFSRISGSWSRSAAGVGGPVTLGSRLASGAASGAVDLHLSATDVSYTPSLTKSGDTVQVRFKVRNDGTADAKGVPIALQINGVTVASDTFDVGAGHTTLGGLQWNSASAPANARPTAVRPAGMKTERRSGSRQVVESAGDAIERPAGPTRVSAMLVIDPQHTIQQKTTLDKSAPLAHFSIRSADSTAGTVGGSSSQRALLEIQEGACAGMRLATGGVGPCGSAELELTVVDVGKGTYTLNADSGVADLGAAFAGAALGNARFSPELAAAAGHSYAVQLRGRRTAVVTVDSIRNPSQLDAATRAVFRYSAIRVMRSLGADSGPPATGDLAGGIRGASVFVQLTVQVQ